MGVNSGKQNITDACLVNQTLYQNSKCSNQLDTKQINDSFVQKCRGNSACDINIEIFKTKVSDSDCIKNATFFIQYTCEIDAATKETKLKSIRDITAATLFISFVYIGMIYYLQTTSKKRSLKYNANHITLTDFGAEMKITDDMYDYFLNEHYQDICEQIEKQEAYQ